jgi:hypothetical protein
MAVEPVVDRLAGGADQRAGQQHAASTIHQRPASGRPEATTPQQKAHIGGNQVIGLNSSATAEGAGSSIGACCA